MRDVLTACIVVYMSKQKNTYTVTFPDGTTDTFETTRSLEAVIVAFTHTWDNLTDRWLVWQRVATLASAEKQALALRNRTGSYQPMPSATALPLTLS